VGQYLDRHFVSAFQKVGTFQIVGGVQKQGGNVAAYFCTPQGEVLHALAGPVNGLTFLQESRWAKETYELAQLEEPAPAAMRLFFRRAHLERLQREHFTVVSEKRMPAPEAITAKYLDQVLTQNRRLGLGSQAQVHLLLATGALPKLEHVYRPVFERILNEQVSTNPVAGLALP